jgi:hypothetical protein
VDSVLKVPFELPSQCEAAFEDDAVDGGKVILSLFKLLGVCGDEFIGGEQLDEVGDKEGG